MENEGDSDLEQQQTTSQSKNKIASPRNVKQKKQKVGTAKNNKPKKEKDEEEEDSDDQFEYEDDDEYYQKFMEQTSKVPLNDEDDLKHQLRLEKEFAERASESKKMDEGVSDETQVKTKIDPDGTEYEWDPSVKGWFPKIPDNRFIEYLKTYGQGSSATPVAARQPLANTNYYINGAFFKWDFSENKWINVTDPVYAYVDYMTGVNFEWDSEKNEWKSLNQSTAASSVVAQVAQTQSHPVSQEKGSNKEKASPKQEGWFQIDDEKNTNVYVSGLPLDISDQEYEEMMTKYGIVMKDPLTSKLKLKLYRDDNNEVKGDARCCYLMPESVKLCLQLLDGSEYKGHKIKVEKAKFEMKGGNFDQAKANINAAKKKKLNKSKEKKLIEQQRQKLLDWEERPDVVRKKHEKVVVIKNVFSLNDIDKDSKFASKLRDDLKAELETYGTVKKIIVQEKNPEGVVTVSFVDVDDADTCCEYLDNRVWKNGRIISCKTWDGETKYDVEETDEERLKRIDEWHQFLESDE